MRLNVQNYGHSPLLLCMELAGFHTGAVNTKALVYTKTSSLTRRHTQTHTELGFSGKRTHVTTAHVGQ